MPWWREAQIAQVRKRRGILIYKQDVWNPAVITTCQHKSQPVNTNILEHVRTMEVVAVMAAVGMVEAAGTRPPAAR